jgi:hypothetical protein
MDNVHITIIVLIYHRQNLLDLKYIYAYDIINDRNKEWNGQGMLHAWGNGEIHNFSVL